MKLKSKWMWTLAFFMLILFSLPGVPLRKTLPVIDGDLSDPVWKDLPWRSHFTVLAKRTPAKAQTRFKCFHDGKNLYFAVECDEPFLKKLKCTAYPVNSGRHYNNDSVEINLVPDKKLMKFYKVVVDTNASYSDFIGQDDNTDRNVYLFNGLWRSGAGTGVRLGKNKYTVEVAIPFGALNYDPQNDHKWRINVSRNRYTVKGGEFSSYAPLSKFSHAVPAEFKTFMVEGFRVRNYLFDMENFRGKVLNRGQSQDYQASAIIHNNTGDFRIFQSQCTLTDVRTGKTYKEAGKITLERHSFKKCSVTVKNVPNGEYTVNWDLYSNRSRLVLTKRLVTRVNVEYIPLKITLKRPAYRNNIYHTMKDKTIEAVITLQPGVQGPLHVTLTGKNYRKEHTLSQVRTRSTVLFDGKTLPKGDYTLTVSCMQNKKRLSDTVRIRVLPYQKGEVYLDARGVPHVDGKEFFSYGWYSSHGPKHPYYNTNLNIARFSGLPQAVRMVKNTFEKYNMRTMVFPFQDLAGYNDWRWVIFKDPDTRKKGLTDLQKQKIREFITGIRSQEGLLGYYMADEPECRDGNPLWYEEAYALIRELDPYHPCFMLNWGVDGVRKYYKACDILLPDCYPQYFEDSSTGKPRWVPSDYAKVTTSLRPAWQMPQATSWPDLSRDGKLTGIAPTVFDLRSQVFQPIAHNVKGINYYSWVSSQRYTPAILAPPVIGKTIAEASPYLLENSVPGGVEVTTKPRFAYFQTGLKVHQGKLCLIAVNTSLQKLSVTFRMKTPFSGMLYPEGAKRSVKVVKGVFTDTFLPNETILYFSDRTLAGKLTCGRELAAKAEKARLARKKKGNLVAMGDMYGIDYIRFGKKLYKEGMPVITASSDKRSYTTRQTGSLYYLVDGLTEPNRMEYSWSPLPGDKKRFVQFKLAKASPVRKVILYTPYGNLRSGFVTINNKNYPFDNRKKANIIAIVLPEKVITDQIRITCSKIQYAGKRDLEERLLTEVEIY